MWQGESDAIPMVEDEREILAQRLIEADLQNYNTQYSGNGPRHAGRAGLKIGNRIDNDSDGQSSLMADGDDTNDLDDDDGISGILLITPDKSLSLPVTVQNSTGSSATLYGRIDFNADGVFDNSTERASISVPTGISGLVTLPTQLSRFSFPEFYFDNRSTKVPIKGFALGVPTLMCD